MKETTHLLSVVTTAAIVVTAGAHGGGPASAADVTRTEEQLSLADVPAETDYLGFSVVTDGSTALVGAVYDDAPSNPDAGAV